MSQLHRDAMDGVAEEVRGKVQVPLSDLSPSERDMIMAQDTDFYQPTMHLGLSASDQEVYVPCGDMISLRGSGLAPVTSTMLKERGSRRGVVGFKYTQEDADGHPQIVNGPSVGPSIFSSGEPADSIKCAFHADTRTPNIKITTRRRPKVEADTGLLSTRIYVQDLDVSAASGHVSITIRPTDTIG
jgi:hypothetical protein